MKQDKHILLIYKKKKIGSSGSTHKKNSCFSLNTPNNRPQITKKFEININIEKKAPNPAIP